MHEITDMNIFYSSHIDKSRLKKNAIAGRVLQRYDQMNTSQVTLTVNIIPIDDMIVTLSLKYESCS